MDGGCCNGEKEGTDGIYKEILGNFTLDSERIA